MKMNTTVVETSPADATQVRVLCEQSGIPLATLKVTRSRVYYVCAGTPMEVRASLPPFLQSKMITQPGDSWRDA